MEPSPEDEIRARIAGQGRITFAEFMEVALYHPEGGYYARRAPEGIPGDFYTSAAAHPAYGALLSIQLWLMWEAMERPNPFYAIEMGAGSGLLARDVVEYALGLPGPFRRALRYAALDRAPAYAASDGRPPLYQRIVAKGVPVRGVIGCLLSNELVDSFPVHRFQIAEGAVKEEYVALRDGELVTVLGEPSTPLLVHRMESLGFPLPEGYRGEVNLQIGHWMAAVTDALERGFLLTIDYGYEAPALYAPERAGGTLQTYYRHTAGSSPYQRIGMQDLTAHVDFSSIISGGQAVGLRPVAFFTQAEFLARLGLDRWINRVRRERLSQRERDANLMAMRDLLRPEGLGGFRVLIQEKVTGIADFGQHAFLRPLPDEPEFRAEGLPVPLLGADRVPLMEGRYPHAGLEVEELWFQGIGGRTP